MDLFTLTPGFLRDELVEGYSSIIWNERYTKAGEFELVLPYTKGTETLLAKGTFLQIGESDEVMMVVTAQRKDNLLRIKGPSLVDFLRYRIWRYSSDPSVRSIRHNSYDPGQFMIGLVYDFCVSSSWGFDSQVLTGLTTASAEYYGSEFVIEAEYGPIYDTLVDLSEKYKIGITLVPTSADEEGYVLNFRTYLGRNLTSDQDEFEIVRFSPDLGSLQNVEEVWSMDGYRNIAYVYATGFPYNEFDPYPTESPVIVYADEDASETSNFARRPMMVLVDDVRPEDVASDPSSITDILTQRGRNALANNNFTHVVDGEVVPNNYQFGDDYKLGDIVELLSPTGTIQHARIDEFIRSKDSTGQRAYPTVSVV